MKINRPDNEYINRNVMELLVEEEIQRQVCRLPNNIKKFINPIEVATYALNRLPPLYASSEKGFNKQKLKGRSQHSVQITQEVRKGFAAIQKDPLRPSIPLVAGKEYNLDQDMKEAHEALNELSEYFPDKDISWKNIVKLVKPLLAEIQEQDQAELNAKKVRSKSSNLWEDSAYKK